MGNYFRLLDEEQSKFEVVGFAENLQGNGPQVRELGPIQARQAYAAAGDFLYERLHSDQGVCAGDVLLYDFRKDRWATLTFVVADAIRIEPVTDII